MVKKVAVITWDAESVLFYARQVKEIFGQLVEVTTYNVQDGSANHIQAADLYLVSTCAFEGERVNEYLPLGGEIVITQVTVTKEALYRLLAMPRGMRALLVNINPKMVTETMAYLNHIGVNNIKFEPYYPGMASPPILDTAVTPGESRYVPAYVKNIIDIGARLLSADTLVEMAFKLKCDDVLQQPVFRQYIQKIVDNHFAIQCLYNRTMQMEGMYELLQEVLDAGVIGADTDGIIFTFNEKAEYVTGVRREDVLGRVVQDALPFLPFEECFSTRKAIKSKLVRLPEQDINVTVTPIIRRDNLLGAFAIVQRFKDEENKQHKLRMQFLNKGYETKYTFDSILGESAAITEVKKVAKRMAASNASVLITGESGTGKELFAHAMHAASPRSEYPFVAINCAAIPDSLLESELFGYEDGAFTGAKKGGKIGFFEFAHKGTLFLDEIEGMSPLLQVKLLRVIQEKEVVRVGGHKVIYVDVRIIAATNENLGDMVRRGEFRKDLYYRLAVLPVELPPLRRRGRDVLLIMEHMKRQVGADFQLSPETEEIFLNHHWAGNIRELRNCIEYLAFVGEKIILPSDLPPTMKKSSWTEQAGPSHDKLTAAIQKAAGKNYKEYVFVLCAVAHAAETGTHVGRKSIAMSARQQGVYLSEQEVRTILNALEKLGLIKIRRGRGGSIITEYGQKVAERVKMVE